MGLHETYRQAIAALNDGFIWRDRKDRIGDWENPDFKIVFPNAKPKVGAARVGSPLAPRSIVRDPKREILANGRKVA